MFEGKLFKIGFALYFAIAVVCFGPATVQSENAKEKDIKECREAYGKEALCLSMKGTSDGLPKALFWPLWLSYMAASRGT